MKKNAHSDGYSSVFALSWDARVLIEQIQVVHGGRVAIVIEHRGVEGVGRVTISAIWQSSKPDLLSDIPGLSTVGVAKEWPHSDHREVWDILHHLLSRLDWEIGNSYTQKLLPDGSGS